jgi:protein disulfide-isomerase-like protein
MLFKQIIPAAIALLPALASAAAVQALTPSTFGDVVLKSGKPALVEFFAPWCGHCKNLAPVYEELATVFQHASDKVTVASVDADEHKSLGKDYGVSGFPTIKWFDGKSNKPVDYSGGRDLESLSKFITEKTSLKPKVKGKLPSQLVYLNDQTFKQKVGKDQDVLVAFTAPWCGRMCCNSPFAFPANRTQTARLSPLSGRPLPTPSPANLMSWSPRSMPKPRTPKPSQPNKACSPTPQSSTSRRVAPRLSPMRAAALRRTLLSS